MSKRDGSGPVCCAEMIRHGGVCSIIIADPRHEVPHLLRLPLDDDALRLPIHLARAASPHARQALAVLGDRLIRPLLERIDGAAGLYLAPHDDLHLVPWAMLPVNGSRPLAEILPLAIVPSASFISASGAGTGGAGIELVTGPEQGADRSIARAVASVGIDIPAPQHNNHPSVRMVIAHGREAPARDGAGAILLSHKGRPHWMTAESFARRFPPADIMCLAVCSSSTHQVAVGDEPLGLAWSLLAAGTRTVLAPLWPVAPEPAAAMVAAFVTGLSRGMAAGLAFASALGIARREHPPAALLPFMLHGDLNARVVIPAVQGQSRA